MDQRRHVPAHKSFGERLFAKAEERRNPRSHLQAPESLVFEQGSLLVFLTLGVYGH